MLVVWRSGRLDMAIAGDTPIESATDDVLGRAGQASRFAAQVALLDASRGLVVGVLGPWGSGKTSFINLARDGFAVADMPLIDFNPWMFSGAEQLVDRFFTELGEELKLRPGLEHIGNQIEEYGELFGGLGWLPFVGPWIERGRALSKLARKVIERRRKPSRPMRERLTNALAALEHPLVVVLDDVDRLSSAEIREIFKLIRLTASFPNVIYIVAFDRFRVEQALSDGTVTGRAYLEKILQLAVDLPAVPTRVLQRAVTEAMQRAVGDIEGIPFDQAAWPDTFVEIISPLIATMRDVRRYEAAIIGTVPALGGDVDLGDALALEAVRVFLPDVYRAVALGIDGLKPRPSRRSSAT
jgi:predicted KAP-like P-loop ATPase